MEIYNIKIDLGSRIEYSGYISMDELGSFYGIGEEHNYGAKVNFLGHLGPDGVYINVVSKTGNIPIMAATVKAKDNSKVDSLKSEYFYGTALDNEKDEVSIEIASIENIEKYLEANKESILSLKIRDNAKKTKS